jgi:hypothetical protein
VHGSQVPIPGDPDNDGIHLSATGYQLLGEKTAQVYNERAILGHDWQPLEPVTLSRSAAAPADGGVNPRRVVTVTFNVPVPPLNWDMALDAPLISAWTSGNGFELWSGGNDGATTNVTIASVAIFGNSVQITAASDLPTTGLMVGYAMADSGRANEGRFQGGPLGPAARLGPVRRLDDEEGESELRRLVPAPVP